MRSLSGSHGQSIGDSNAPSDQCRPRDELFWRELLLGSNPQLFSERYNHSWRLGVPWPPRPTRIASKRAKRKRGTKNRRTGYWETGRDCRATMCQKPAGTAGPQCATPVPGVFQNQGRPLAIETDRRFVHRRVIDRAIDRVVDIGVRVKGLDRRLVRRPPQRILVGHRPMPPRIASIPSAPQGRH